MRVIGAEGFDGSYESLTRHLREVRGPRQRSASVVTVPIETGPGEEFQFDWSDANHWARRWGWEHELHCFGAVLCWSRVKSWWFSSSIERSHTFEGLARFFEAVDGVGAVGRTDRMGCLGRSRGKAFICTRRRWSSPTTTASPSRPATPPTPPARARSSGPSATSRAASSPRWTSTRPPTSAS